MYVSPSLLEPSMLPRGNNGLAPRGRSSVSSPCSLCNPMTSPGLQSEQRLGSEHLPCELGLGQAYCLPLGCWHIPLGCNASLLHNTRSAKALVQYHYNTVNKGIKASREKLSLLTLLNCGTNWQTVQKTMLIWSLLRIPNIHYFISYMVLLHAKNKAVYLKVANSVVHVQNDEYINVNTPKTLIFVKFQGHLSLRQ